MFPSAKRKTQILELRENGPRPSQGEEEDADEAAPSGAEDSQGNASEQPSLAGLCQALSIDTHTTHTTYA